MSSSILHSACTLCLFASLLLSAAPVQAQDSIELSSLRVELWPEYDKPSVLVIIDGVLKPEVPLPATVTIHIPTTTGAPHAVAMKDAGGALLTAPFTTTPAGDRLAVTLATDYPGFHVEYYDPTLAFNASARDYAFEWVSDYPVEAAAVRVQQPVGASGMTFTPSLTSSGLADFGLNYYAGSLGALKAGQALTLKVSYTKADSRLSAEAIGGNESAPAPAPPGSPEGGPAVAAQPATSSATLALVIGIVGGALLVGGGVYYWYTRQAEARATPRAKGKAHTRKHRIRAGRAQLFAHAPPGSPEGGPERRPVASAPARFCTQCGHEVLAGGQFCRNCGAQVRP